MTTPDTTTHDLTTETGRHAYAIAAATDVCEELEPWELARLADCGCPAPGEEGSVGRDALDTARNVAVEACDWELAGVDPDAAREICEGNGGDDLESLTDDSRWENLDGSAVLIYTHQTRAAFHELNGWDEDVSDFGPPEDLGQAATWAVFGILRRCSAEVARKFAEAYLEARDEVDPDEAED